MPIRCALILTLLAGCASAPSPARSSASLPAPPSPVYRESLRDAPHPRYFMSMRTHDEAERFGWQQLGVAFFAYAMEVPGSVPVYCETPMSAPHSDYRYSIGPEAAAREDGWMRINVAFYAFAEARPGLVAVHAETPIDSPQGPYDYTTRDAVEARGFGWDSRAIAFYAVDARSFTRAE